VPGQIGLVQAAEVLKFILGIGKPLIGRFLVYDALEADFQVLQLGRKKECPLCGEQPTITNMAESANRLKATSCPI